MNRAPDFSSQVAEQAVHWLMEMQQGALTPRQQLAWQQWLDAHSEHQRAWEHIQRVNQRLRGVSSPLAHAALIDRLIKGAAGAGDVWDEFLRLGLRIC